MFQFLANYGLFLAKTTTIVIAIILVVAFILGMASKGKESKNQLKIKKLNKCYDEYKKALNSEILNKGQIKQLAKTVKKELKAAAKSDEARDRVFVLSFNGDIRASATSSLREEVTALLTIAKPSDEVVVRVESPGGIVASYGLAASQLRRLREQDIPLTICVDKVAASGGYMMACVGNKILAAPYAIIGSIGVVAQLPNFHRLLKKNNIDFEQIMAGEYKRTLSMFGEVTDKGREKVQEDVNNVQEIFKRFIRENRPEVDVNQVATGEHWHGVDALHLRLVDELKTSDDYLLHASKTKDIYEVHYQQKKSFAQKLSFSARKAQESLLNNFNQNSLV